MEFKDHNGFRRVNLPRYYIPLTNVGRMALALGLHKGWTSRVPDPILSRLRSLRKAWYLRKMKTVGA